MRDYVQNSWTNIKIRQRLSYLLLTVQQFKKISEMLQSEYYLNDQHRILNNHFNSIFSYLYTILSDKAFNSLQVLILCNKQDETFAKSKSVIETLLEKEM